jgi:oligopeptide/dipeptide ABC transporter ATP-binding protein
VTALLEVRDLRVEIPTAAGVVHAVAGVSFTVDERQTMGLVGESGSGKTMTLKAIMSLLPAGARVASGEILYRGEDLLQMGPRQLADLRGVGMSMIFQEPMSALNPVMRVGAQIAEGPVAHLGYSRRKAQSYAIELLERVGIPDAERRARLFPHEMSGGMRQRVMIAIAVACKPALILCDEPTTALDVTIQDQILELLKELCLSTGAGLVYVTHDLAVVAQVCQSLTVMYAGQIIESGPKGRVLTQPRHPYTLGLLRSVPDVERRRELVSIPGRPPSLVSPPSGCPFHPRCPLSEDDCTAGEFPLRAVADGRFTACIHDEKCAQLSASVL